MISINATLVAQVIHFLILVFILNRLMLQPLLKLVREREGYTKKTKDEIRDTELRIGELKEEFISKEIEARKEASKERANVIDSGISEAEVLFNESRQVVVEIRNNADGKAEAEIDKTKPLLRDQAALLVEGIMEKIIGRRVRV